VIMQHRLPALPSTAAALESYTLNWPSAALLDIQLWFPAYCQSKLFDESSVLHGYQVHSVSCVSVTICQPQDIVCACSGSDSIEAYVSPAMLQDPWAKLMQQHLHHMAESEPVPADALEHNASVSGQPGQSLADVFAAAELVRFRIDASAFFFCCHAIAACKLHWPTSGDHDPTDLPICKDSCSLT